MWLFFRDDDLGWSPEAFSRLLTLFAKHDQKLNAAGIPSALDEATLARSIPYSYQAAPYLQIVTHGHSHTNYQKEGKKAEYGAEREVEDVMEELAAGRRLLEGRLENYFPCFVPPWNRMSDCFLPLLAENGFLMLSRDENARRRAGKLPEFNVSVDLHTSKGPRRSAKEIFRELARRHEAGLDHTGVMLHHGKMVEEDFTVLDELLRELSKRSIQASFFSDMLPGFERRSGIEVSHV